MHLRAALKKISLRGVKFARKICLVPNVAVGLDGLRIKLVNCEAHVIRKVCHFALNLLDVFALKVLHALVVSIHHATQAVEAAHWGA